jgi:hypothetical protein
MAGTIVANTINTDTAGAVFTTANAMTGIAKAWVSYNATTGSIYSSFNISSVTRLSTGYSTINITTAMSNTTYAAVASCSSNESSTYIVPAVFTNNGSNATVAPTTSAFRVNCGIAGTGSYDPTYVNVAVFGS